MFETNFFALASLLRRVLPGMRARGRGHVVNISSVGGLIGNPGSSYYNATKFAVEGLTEALAKEVEGRGIRVTAVEPGPFRTDWAGRSLRQARHPIAAYAAVAGARRRQVAGSSGKQPGDPPLHLILGSNALGRVRDKLSRLTGALDEWESVSRDADYPEGR